MDQTVSSNPDDGIITTSLLRHLNQQSLHRLAFTIALRCSYDIYLCSKLLVALMCTIDLAYRGIAFKNFFSPTQTIILVYLIVDFLYKAFIYFIRHKFLLHVLFREFFVILSFYIYFSTRSQNRKIFEFLENRSDWVWKSAKVVFFFKMFTSFALYLFLLLFFFFRHLVRTKNRLRLWYKERVFTRILNRLVPVPYTEWRDLEAAEGLRHCPVCLADFDAAKPIVVLPNCRHSFHHQCIVSWIKMKDSCPLCKQEVLKYIQVSS